MLSTRKPTASGSGLAQRQDSEEEARSADADAGQNGKRQVLIREGSRGWGRKSNREKGKESNRKIPASGCEGCLAG